MEVRITPTLNSAARISSWYTGKRRNPRYFPQGNAWDFSIETCLRENVLHDIPSDVGETEVATVEAIRQLFVVEPHQVQQRGVQIVDVDLLLDRLVAERISGSVMESALHSAAGHPDRESVWVVVAAFRTL